MTKTKYFEDYKINEHYISQSLEISEKNVLNFIALFNSIQPMYGDKLYSEHKLKHNCTLVPSILIMSIADSYFRINIGQNSLYSHDFDYDRIRFVHNVFAGESIITECKLITKEKRDGKYGTLIFQTCVYKQGKIPVVYMRNCLAVPYRDRIDTQLLS